jgi:hypothetical protein
MSFFILRLLGTHSEGLTHMSPLTPAELLIALHNIDPSKCELKTVIKGIIYMFLSSPVRARWKLVYASHPFFKKGQVLTK